MSLQLDIPALIVHTPVQPPRRGHTGEQVFAERWQELMATMPRDWTMRDLDDEKVPVEVAYLQDILDYTGLIADQRAAHVAASIVCWLGTNCGRCFLSSIERFRALHGYNAGLVAWSLENAKKSRAISHGIRTLEYLLAGKDCIRTGPFYLNDFPFVKLPELSVTDYEVAEAIAAWLGNAGKGFVLGCERELERRNHFDRAIGLAKFQVEVNGRIDFGVSA